MLPVSCADINSMSTGDFAVISLYTCMHDLYVQSVQLLSITKNEGEQLLQSTTDFLFAEPMNKKSTKCNDNLLTLC